MKNHHIAVKKDEECCSSLFVIFNHTLTAGQRLAAGKELGTKQVVALPPELAILWRQVPPELTDLAGYLTPIIDWLNTNCSPEDFILIQGEFGATFLVVSHALKNAWQPIYSTTRRQADEVHTADDKVELHHSFQHVRFRRYRHQEE